jgi:hypothetical protein
MYVSVHISFVYPTHDESLYHVDCRIILLSLIPQSLITRAWPRNGISKNELMKSSNELLIPRFFFLKDVRGMSAINAAEFVGEVWNAWGLMCCDSRHDAWLGRDLCCLCTHDVFFRHASHASLQYRRMQRWSYDCCAVGPSWNAITANDSIPSIASDRYDALSELAPSPQSFVSDTARARHEGLGSWKHSQARYARVGRHT